MSATDEEARDDTAPSGDRFVHRPSDGLRSRTARGAVVNSLFLIGTNALTLLQGLIAATLLPVAVYGQWGLLMAAFITLLMLGQVGIEDKYIQQDDRDQQRAFEIAFTLQAVLGVVFVLILAVGMPGFALLYDRGELVGPGIALALAIPALALQMPLWVHYRRMDFFRQRMLQLVDAVVTFTVTVSLALAGLDLWALVIGALVGSWTAAAVIVWQSPYRLRFRWEPEEFRTYLTYSLPLFGGSLSSAALVQAPVIIGSRFAGIGAVAGLALANNVAQFTSRVDGVITQTLYPAICAVRDRADLLFESFWKSNRLALLWAAPLGTAAALFAGDFVHFAIGEKWRFAVPLIAIYGINAALNQVAFNWTAFFRAIGNTGPVGTVAFVQLIAVLAIPVPLLGIYGVTEFAVGMTAVTLIGLAQRLWYLRRIFPGRPIVRKTVTAAMPTLPAVAGVLVLRLAAPGPRSGARVAAEAALFVAVVLPLTYFAERGLLKESIGYFRGARPAVGPPPAATSSM